MTALPEVLDRAACAALDRADPLTPLRGRFLLDVGIVYLDGNSLGALPAATPPRLAATVSEEWGRGLIRSWTQAGWIEAPRRLGDRLAPLIGAEPGEVLVADSTSVNLFKLLGAAVRARPGRRVILSHRSNFPADLYVAQGLCELLGGACELRTVAPGELAAALDEDVAVLMVTHVDYATGEVQDMAALSAAARDRGALSLWDLSHSAGALPVDLAGSGADLAVGCGYKYLNGGPGAPAFLYVPRRLQETIRSPLRGWMGHAEPFAFEPGHRHAAGIEGFLCGTPPILGMAALEAALELWSEVDIEAVRAKSMRLGDLLIRLVDERCPGLGLSVASPRDATRRGSQVSLRHPRGYGVVRALIDRGVIGDFRTPDIVRLGLAPLYVRHVDIWDAVDALVDVLTSGAHERPEYAVRAAVT
ncbi:MAG TPA: kynureninase [Candidatus Dormibacteraeota bacterium]|jgi:kynureninase|nr:kynureninase [Candidatus Dormibacteraeota bacterium]